MIISEPILAHVKAFFSFVIVPRDKHWAIDSELVEVSSYIVAKIETKMIIFNFEVFFHDRFHLQWKV